MPTWDSSQYLKFSNERTQPAIDLAARIALDAPVNVVDLGCGPGNSTAVLARRWPQARLTGVDSSSEMISSAQKQYPQWNWQTCDITNWSQSAKNHYDVIFANAALQWVPDHTHLFPRLLGCVAPGGAFAMQVPGNHDAPAHVIARELSSSPSWQSFFSEPVREWSVKELPFYYDILAPLATRMDLWTTEYLHVMPNADAIVEWYKGTGLRPFLEKLESPSDKTRFLSDYSAAIQTAYTPRADGRVLFPFRRLFLIAYR